MLWLTYRFSKCDILLCTAAAIFYWLNPCDWIVGALMSYCCELNSLNRNANASRGKKTLERHGMSVERCSDSLTIRSQLFAVLHVSCTMLQRQTKSSACVRICDWHGIQFESNANANGELHVRNTRASNNSFHLNYRSNDVFYVPPPLPFSFNSLLCKPKIRPNFCSYHFS